ncbi:MAG: hypothetical protein ABR514_00995 [Chthoniobacterales bacterium]
MTMQTFPPQIAAMSGILVLLALGAVGSANAQERRPPRVGSPTNSEIQYVEAQAAIYGINSADAVKNYTAMFNPDQMLALEAGSFFEEHKAYTILAAALPNVSGLAYALAIDALLSKTDYDPDVFQAVVQELDSVNAIPDTEGNGNEDPGANETVKKRICKALARWVNLPEPNFDRSGDLFAQFAAFSAEAKAKAATMTTPAPSPSLSPAPSPLPSP